jgi:hypothetical protein
LLDLFDCLICLIAWSVCLLESLLEFIGTFSMLAFVSACLLEYFVLPCSFCL